MVVFCVSAAFCEGTGIGIVSEVIPGGVMRISGGMDRGFEIGDVVIVQRSGTKIGIATIYKVSPSGSVAQLTMRKSNQNPSPGDIVSYQILTGNESTSYYNKYGSMPSFPELTISTPDSISADKAINRYQAELERNPNSRSAMIRLADAYFKKGWYKHSVLWNQKAIQASRIAVDNDKLLFQIIRAYGYLNLPDKQQVYIDYLKKNYPGSVFTHMNAYPETGVRKPVEKLLSEWGGSRTTPIITSRGLMKSGMKVVAREKIETTYPDQPPTTVETNVGNKLFHGKPELISPGTDR